MYGLYPLKFKPVPRKMIWGGNKLRKAFGKDFSEEAIGESWEISGFPGFMSVVDNGHLKGNSIEELIEVYMGDLVGEANFNLFGLEFPLLIKFIDAEDVLSVQVHPDDERAAIRGGRGKTEMWYILEAEPGAELISGFNRKISPGIFRDKLKDGKLLEILNFEKVHPGDVFFMPAGRVHAIGKGIVLAEIQQTSDSTYRIYDWDRRDANGNTRQLHIEEAMQVMDFDHYENYRTHYEKKQNSPVLLAECPYFTTNLLNIQGTVYRDYSMLDSFVIYICTGGRFILEWENGKTEAVKGETLLLPAIASEVVIKAEPGAEILEVFTRQEKVINPGN
jgi:mannose-6-phosphate isomerase